MEYKIAIKLFYKDYFYLSDLTHIKSM